MNTKYWRGALVFVLVASMMLGFSLAAFAGTYGTLSVTYCDDETIEYDFPISKSGASHLYVEKTSGCLVVKEAYLEIDGEIYNWTGEGSQYADLSDYDEGIWHWVFTPSKNLVISDSEGFTTLGCMEIVKLFEDYPEGWKLPESITVMIYGDEEGLSYPVAGEEVTIYEKDGEYVWNRCDLIPGDYTVSKTALEGWSLSMVPADGKVTVVAGDDPADLALVTITNTFQYGCLELQKSFDAPEGVALPDQVEVMVYGPSYPEEGYKVTLTAKDNWYWKACDLIPGKYSIKELDIEGWTSTYPLGTSVEVVADETARLEILNTFDTGCLELQKFFDAPEGVEYPAEVVVMVYGESYPDGYKVVLEADSYYYKLCDLLPGKYKIEEVSFPGWTTTYSPGQVVEVMAGETARIEITNTFIPPVSETAWAAHDIGVHPYNPGRGGNWATYVAYNEGGMTVPLLAGQYYLAGWVTFSAPSGGYVDISISLLNGVMFEEGKTNIAIQDYENAPKGNPAPGRFAHKYTASGSSYNSISVPENNFYGVHALVCGWDMEIYTGGDTTSEIASVAGASANELVEQEVAADEDVDIEEIEEKELEEEAKGDEEDIEKDVDPDNKADEKAEDGKANKPEDKGKESADDELEGSDAVDSDDEDAEFEAELLELDLSIEGEGSVKNGSSNMDERVHPFDKGKELELEALPAEGWEFDKWVIDGKPADDGPILELTVEVDVEVVAVFVEIVVEPEPEPPVDKPVVEVPAKPEEKPEAKPEQPGKSEKPEPPGKPEAPPVLVKEQEEAAVLEEEDEPVEPEDE